jgi:AcrR family transcriptional regulator
MKRKLTNDKAIRVLSSARQEFSRWGFAGGRVDRIVAGAGVNRQLLFYYFQSKRGLFHAVLRQAAVELEESLAAGAVRDGTPFERLRGAHGAVRLPGAAPDLVSLLTHGTRIEAGVFAPAIKRLVVLLAEGQGLGQVRGDVDPHVAAAQALVLMLGYLRLEPMIAASAPTLTGDAPALRAQWMRSAVELFVEGVRAGE